MIRINFFGDFKADSVEGLCLSDDILNIIQSAQGNVINFEVPILPPPSAEPIPKSGPTHFQDSLSTKWVEQQGFDIISLANNHMMDYGVEGLEMTRNAFRKSKTCGAGDWNEAYSPLIHNIDDVKIAILGLAHYEFGMLADRWDNRYNAGVAWINHPGVDKIIVETKKNCDYLLIFAHAGVEHIEQPLPEWRDRYRSMIDLGCDAIIGSHPHIAQGWEVYNGKPIVYSLGNFYFFTKRVKARQWHVSLCVTLMLSDKGKIDLNITPLTFSEKYIEVDKSDETLKYLSREI